jgi:DNA-binding MarR family transcriptional regulator
MTSKADAEEPADLLDSSLWRPLRLMLDRIDADIARVYTDAGIERFRTRYTMPLIRLHREGPLTIRELALQVDVTHSAMSQTVSAMRRAGLVTTEPGADARTRRVTLTAQARRLVPVLEGEWRATERALRELEVELPYPLTRVVRDIGAALDRRSFHDRLRDHLERRDDPGGPSPS